MSSESGRAGDLFVISAPSGTGKTTLARRLLQEVERLVFSVSHTTRAPRAGEVEGIDYYFVDRPRFERMAADGEFLEWAEVGDALYGTSRRTVERATSAGQDMLLDVDTQGAAAIRRLLPGAILIFIMPPGLDALRQRLRDRGSESPEAVERRVGLAAGEISRAGSYDYVVVNDDLGAAFERLKAIFLAARCRTGGRFGDPGGPARGGAQ
jgi:guanylate kinase